MPETGVSILSRALDGFWETYLHDVEENVTREVATVLDVIALDDVGNAVKTAVSSDTPGTALKCQVRKSCASW